MQARIEELKRPQLLGAHALAQAIKLGKLQKIRQLHTSSPAAGIRCVIPHRCATEIPPDANAPDLLPHPPAPVEKTTNRWRSRDRKSTRLNSSHVAISYAVFCLKKKKTKHNTCRHTNK